MSQNICLKFHQCRRVVFHNWEQILLFWSRIVLSDCSVRFSPNFIYTTFLRLESTIFLQRWRVQYVHFISELLRIDAIVQRRSWENSVLFDFCSWHLKFAIYLPAARDVWIFRQPLSGECVCTTCHIGFCAHFAPGCIYEGIARAIFDNQQRAYDVYTPPFRFFPFFRQLVPL